ncbi:MAG: type IV secretory system conjugative DNA transfer family protein [Candidatus Dormibacteraeota bacterium]|nr:type IV secretory system conjugative DNA transfer family protein [Candidatus Dormibacteraeota bacterium]
MEKRQQELLWLLAPAAVVGAGVVASAVREGVLGGTPPAQRLAGLGATLGVVLAVGALIWLSRPRTALRPGSLGGARTARLLELRRLWRGGEARVRLGRIGPVTVRLPEDEHLLVLGPTGSGKSSSLAIPAILEWPGPVVVTDPKGELLARTLTARERRGRAAVFAPLMEPGDGWNPVSAIASSDDALRSAGFLLGRPPEREPFWHDLALQLLHGLLVEAAAAGLTLSDVLSLLQQVPAEEVAEEVSHPLARQLVQGALSGGDRTAMGVVATLVSKLGVFGSDQVARTTARSTFDPRSLASGGLNSLYCVVSPTDAPLVRGLLSALLSACWRAVYASPPPLPVLFVLDEFAQLTALSELPSLVQLGRTQGVRLVLLAQDLASISALYGAETVTALWANCRTKLLLPGISEVDLLDRASRLVGSATLHSADGDHPLQAHPRLPPDEIRRLRRGHALILRGSDHPALVRQVPWYGDRRMRSAAGTPAGRERLPRAAKGRPIAIAAEPRPIAWAQPQGEAR